MATAAATAAAAAAGGADEGAAEGVVLERDARLSHSMVWNWMRSFYDQEGISAWRDAVVPTFVTTNCFIARQYAGVLLAYVRECRAPGGGADPAQPVYLVELGAGHGKFAYLVLRKLLEMRRFWPPPCEGGAPPFCYVVTDFTESNVAHWAGHERFRPMLAEGLVDFAVVDAERDAELTLRVSGRRLDPRTVRGPVALVANYLFDTLRHEAFRFRNGRPHEALLTVSSDRAHEPDVDDPGLIARFRPGWSYRPLAPGAESGYFTGRQADTNAVLERLCERARSGGALRDATVLVPLGAIACIRNFLELAAGGRLLVLAGDKGFCHEEEMAGSGARDPHIAVHGSFSMMVNFDALRHYAASRGGLAETTREQHGFKAALLAFGAPAGRLQGTLEAFERLRAFTPHGFSSLQRALRDGAGSPSLALVLSLLRLSGHDPDVFYRFKQRLLEAVPQASAKEQADARRDLALVYDNYFPLSPARDVAFEIGRVRMALRDYGDAARLFLDSARQCGDHHITQYNLGLCHYYQGSYDAAIDRFERSLALDGAYPDAAAWLARARERASPQPPAPAPAPPRAASSSSVSA